MLANALILALREIRRNLLRSFLTVIGIVIGVASVITLVTLGNGVTSKVTSDIGKLGSNLLMVSPGQRTGPGGSSSSAKDFDKNDVESIQKQIQGVKAVAPSGTQPQTVVFGNENWSTMVTGTTNDYLTAKDWDLESGRSFQDSEMRSGAAVAMIGDTLREELFGDSDPLGQKVRIGNGSYEIIGVLAEKGESGMGRDQDDLALIPLRTFQRRVSGTQDISLILVSVDDSSSMSSVEGRITALLRERRHIKDGSEVDFTIRNMEELAKAMTSSTQVLTALLGAVGAVSLLVGGIGIMNIMLVSVTERTREIGTRLAIGALARDVLLQFLVEAVVLSSLGGIVGIILALSASWILADQLGVPFSLNMGIIAAAFSFSAGIGIVFGFFPARRAAHMDPITALRNE